MAVTENTRAEQSQQAKVVRNFDMGIENRAEAALYGIAAIARIMRGDNANSGSDEMDGSPSLRVTEYTMGGLIEALEILADAADRELLRLMLANTEVQHGN